MDAVSALTRLGGIGSTADLLELTTRKRLRRAVADRSIVHVSRGRYALPSADLARSLAAEIDGHLRLLSAAAHWGWETKWPTHYPQLGVARRPARPVKAEVFVSDVPRRDVDGWATSQVRTVLDCAAELPFDEALAVADSALRHGDVTRDALEAAMGDDPRVRRVVAHATHLAANPFESVLRAILIEAGIDVVPHLTQLVALPRGQGGTRRRLPALQRTDRGRLDRPEVHVGAGHVLPVGGRRRGPRRPGPPLPRPRGHFRGLTAPPHGVS